MIFKIDGNAVAISTFRPVAPLVWCFVLSIGKLEYIEVDDCDRGTLLAFGCVPDIAPEGKDRNIVRLAPRPYTENPRITKFIIEG